MYYYYIKKQNDIFLTKFAFKFRVLNNLFVSNFAFYKKYYKCSIEFLYKKKNNITGDFSFSHIK